MNECHNRLDTTDWKISELDNKTEETNHNKIQRGQFMKNIKGRVTNTEDTLRRVVKCSTDVSEGKERKNVADAISEEIMIKKFCINEIY